MKAYEFVKDPAAWKVKIAAQTLLAYHGAKSRDSLDLISILDNDTGDGATIYIVTDPELRSQMAQCVAALLIKRHESQ